jgi:cation diffusion facilitator family transporter
LLFWEFFIVLMNTREIKKITWFSVGFNIFLAFAKFCAGLWGGSQALMADAVHSFSDLSTDFFVLFGVRFWSKPADQDHPYGHGRVETVVTVAIGLFLMVVGFGIGYRAINGLFYHRIQHLSWIGFWAALTAIIFKELLFRWTMKVGTQAKSSAVIANAWHHRSDALSSIPVAVAIAAAAVDPRLYFLDQLGAFVVSLFILFSGWRIVQAAVSELVDAGASSKDKGIIAKIIKTTAGVRSFHALRSRKVGSGWHLDLHIQVDPDLSVSRGHEISEDVKKRLLKNGPEILDVVVHLEPFIRS